VSRAQAYTLEGIVAAVVIVLAISFGLQAVDTGPFIGGTATETDRLEQRADDLLSVGVETGAVSEAVRCLGPNKQIIDGSANAGDQSRFGQMLNQTFDVRGNSYVIYVSYWNGSEGREERIVSSEGQDIYSEPAAGAVSVSRRLTLYDGMPTLFNSTSRRCDQTGPPVSDRTYVPSVSDPGFYIPDVDASSPVYNVVEVRLVVW